MNTKKHLFLQLKFNSFINKLIGIIILLAFCVILTIYLFSNIIFLDAKHHFIFLIMVILIVLFSLAVFFIHRVVAPVHELDRGVHEISKGNFDVKLHVPRKDELGKVANAFNNMAVELKKMIRAREQLLLDVSHELRTPITRTKLALEFMPDSPEKESIAEDMREMEIMINELLETARLKNGETALSLSSIKVKALLEDTIVGFSHSKERLKLNPVAGHLSIIADESKIKTAVKNITENALKYSADSEQPVEISVIDSPDSIIIRIEDFGIGIPSEKIDLLFEPFYRVDNSRSKKTGGFGLGLHMVKKIMEAHGAKILFTNKESKNETGIVVDLLFYKENNQILNLKQSNQ